MKKLILGIAIMAIGALSAITLMVATVMSPLSVWEYNGIHGWYGNLVGMGLSVPVTVSIVIAIAGLAIAVWGVWDKKE